MNAAQVRTLIRRTASITGALSTWAHNNDINPDVLYEVLGGRRQPAGKILDVLGLEKVITYQPKGKNNGK